MARRGWCIQSFPAANPVPSFHFAAIVSCGHLACRRPKDARETQRWSLSTRFSSAPIAEMSSFLRLGSSCSFSNSNSETIRNAANPARLNVPAALRVDARKLERRVPSAVRRLRFRSCRLRADLCFAAIAFNRNATAPEIQRLFDRLCAVRTANNTDSSTSCNLTSGAAQIYCTAHQFSLKEE